MNDFSVAAFFTEEASSLVEKPAKKHGSDTPRNEFIKQLKARTKQASLAIVNLMERTKSSPGLNVIRYQILKSATSAASNYRAACRARSQNEFFAKISIVVEETDETLFWLELLHDSVIEIDKAAVSSMGKEWQEILKIMATTRKNSRRS